MAFFERVFQAVYRRLTPHARNSLNTWLALELRDMPPLAISQWAHASVLVLAPHSDDEVIGCGGVTALHTQAGTAVHVAIMTDGRWGDGALFDAQLDGPTRAARQQQLIATRKDEALQAAQRLGTRQVHFLDQADGALQPDANAVRLLRDLLQTLRPEVVYLPFVFDLHEDHWQTNRVFAAAAQAARMDAHTLVRGYEVWSPLSANRYADITAVMPKKREALARFTTQLKDQNYLRIVEGLNAYRSNGALGGNGYVEAFHELPLSGYLRVVHAAASRGKLPRGQEPSAP